MWQKYSPSYRSDGDACAITTHPNTDASVITSCLIGLTRSRWENPVFKGGIFPSITVPFWAKSLQTGEHAPERSRPPCWQQAEILQRLPDRASSSARPGFVFPRNGEGRRGQSKNLSRFHVHQPSIKVVNLPKRRPKLFPICIIAKIASCQQMISRAGELDSRFARHLLSLPGPRPPG
jgi:hypothetical protein